TIIETEPRINSSGLLYSANCVKCNISRPAKLRGGPGITGTIHPMIPIITSKMARVNSRYSVMFVVISRPG
ncbi:MAG TPA: hypothetical protein VJ877_06235, partial [Bacteroidales bacterium]|nr:hypothetical protein [Bacteroidales bacterium]